MTFIRSLHTNALDICKVIDAVTFTSLLHPISNRSSCFDALLPFYAKGFLVVTALSSVPKDIKYRRRLRMYLMYYVLWRAKVLDWCSRGGVMLIVDEGWISKFPWYRLRLGSLTCVPPYKFLESLYIFYLIELYLYGL
ncbi:hypothetical protein LINGRAHAP2_LOCUS31048 [Linum grandiflorum]